jgi:acetyltransferase
MLPDEETVLNEFEGKKLVAAYSIPTTREHICTSKEEAIAKAEEFGYPVVLKLVSPDIQHKTEAGAVRLGLEDQQAVAEAYEEVLRNGKAYKPDARIEGVLCYRMIEEPVAEAIVGVLSDPYFGPAVVFGLGGVMVEVLKDRALLIPPISREEARAAIDSTKGSKLLYGFRGKPEADVKALVEVLVKTGEMTADLADRIEALDLNPLLILPKGKGVVAVDALVALKATGRASL